MDQIKALREITGAGMMDCKKALVENGDDVEKAVDWLRAKGLASAAKKAGRVAAEGIVLAHVAAGGAALLEVNCETDFVTKNDRFRQLASDLAAHVWTANPASVRDAGGMYEQTLASTGKSVDESLREAVAVIGENIQGRRFVRFALGGEHGLVHAYIHGGGTHGVLVEASTDSSAAAADDRFKALVNDIALHVCVSAPEYVRREEVPQSAFDRERAIQLEKTIAEGKDAAMAAKIVDGRMGKWYSEVCLVDQPFFKDDKKKVSAVVAETAKALGAKVEIVRIARLVMGEGIEKAASDFAAEVAAQAGL
jgi:elongation factor Ts